MREAVELQPEITITEPIMGTSTVKAIVKATTEQTANKLIKDGWALQATAPGVDKQGYPVIHYAFAWTKEDESPQPGI
jgi:hypothetical protein